MGLLRISSVGAAGLGKTYRSKGNMRSHRDPERSIEGTDLGADGTGRQN